MSADDGEQTTLELRGLDQMLKALKAKPPIARIGILGDKDTRTKGSEKSNATVGAAHEYGTTTIPKRSFLREPLTDNLDRELEKSNAFDEHVLKEVVKEGSVIPWVKLCLAAAEGIVKEAFATGGFGKWKPWKNKYYKNNTGMLLVDTTQLRDSITSDVREA